MVTSECKGGWVEAERATKCAVYACENGGVVLEYSLADDESRAVWISAEFAVDLARTITEAAVMASGGSN